MHCRFDIFFHIHIRYSSNARQQLLSCFFFVSVSIPTQSVTRLTCDVKNVDFQQIGRSAWNLLLLVYILSQRMLRRIGIYDRRLASNGINSRGWSAAEEITSPYQIPIPRPPLHQRFTRITKL